MTAGADRGQEMYALAERLYPICRSITGEGVRETLGLIGERIALDVHEVPSGTQVLDWTVPREWNIRDAYVKDPAGARVVDFREHNLHVLGYSVPVRERMALSALREHLHTLPEHPDWIPYRTSYWQERWGFCLAQRRLDGLEDGEYEVCIESSLEDGHLTYGEHLLAGDSEDEVLIHAHVCHPSLANDNLSGIAVATELARRLAERPRRRYSYRFVFLPGLIGPLTWLSRNEPGLARIRHGLVLALLGDGGPFTHKRTRGGDAEIDRAAAHVLGLSGSDHELRDFEPYGYDERQYGSPGFDLPVGRLTRTPHGEFPEYHTSADNLDLVRPEFLAESLERVTQIVDVLEGNDVYVNTSPKGEPQLGRRGLLDGLGGGAAGARQTALLWVLNLSDGDHSLLEIADRAGVRFDAIRDAADALVETGLLRAP